MLFELFSIKNSIWEFVTHDYISYAVYGRLLKMIYLPAK
jgi:hypothetical protein